jgi:hypothetical protein
VFRCVLKFLRDGVLPTDKAMLAQLYRSINILHLIKLVLHHADTSSTVLVLLVLNAPCNQCVSATTLTAE